MHSNKNKNITIEYDPKIISKIKEMIREGFEKLEICINSKDNPNFDIYNELDDKFNEIAKKLEKYDILHDELNYFLLISDKILYIVYKNCENKHFGHYKFVLDLFDFFMEIWDEKLDLLINYTPLNFKKHQNLKKEFNKKIL